MLPKRLRLVKLLYRVVKVCLWHGSCYVVAMCWCGVVVLVVFSGGGFCVDGGSSYQGKGMIRGLRGGVGCWRCRLAGWIIRRRALRGD